MMISLVLILIVVLLGPIFIKPVGRNIELLFLVVGSLTPILTGNHRMARGA